VILFCCPECGAVLGVVTDMNFTAVSCEDDKDNKNAEKTDGK
jgi:hypothetical protein